MLKDSSKKKGKEKKEKKREQGGNIRRGHLDQKRNWIVQLSF